MTEYEAFPLLFEIILLKISTQYLSHNFESSKNLKTKII